MLQRILCSILGLTVALLAACQNYDFRVNDTVVYSPAPLFRDFDIPDEALRTCLEQAIVDTAATTVEQVSALNCSHAGVVDIGGLARFTALKSLRLSSNRIRNLVELGQITALEELYLDDNQVIDPVPLYQLQSLRQLDLSGNTAMQCPRGDGLAHIETVTLPQHCR